MPLTRPRLNHLILLITSISPPQLYDPVTVMFFFR